MHTYGLIEFLDNDAEAELYRSRSKSRFDLSLLNDFVYLPVMVAFKFYINHVIPKIMHALSRKNLSKFSLEQCHF